MIRQAQPVKSSQRFLANLKRSTRAPAPMNVSCGSLRVRTSPVVGSVVASDAFFRVLPFAFVRHLREDSRARVAQLFIDVCTRE